MAEIAKVLTLIDLSNKYSQRISNAEFDITRDLRLIGIEKYWKCASEMQDKVDKLYKDQILILRMFVKHF